MKRNQNFYYSNIRLVMLIFPYVNIKGAYHARKKDAKHFTQEYNNNNKRLKYGKQNVQA